MIEGTRGFGARFGGGKFSGLESVETEMSLARVRSRELAVRSIARGRCYRIGAEKVV